MAFALSVGASDVEAKATRVASYDVKRTWPTAVRFLRVDLGYELIEKDRESGYVLFEFEHKSKVYKGSLELVPTTDYADRDATRLVIELRERPVYDEDHVLERLIEKLREDLGQPRDKPAKPKEKPKQDDKKDKGDGDGKGKGKDDKGEDETYGKKRVKIR